MVGGQTGYFGETGWNTLFLSDCHRASAKWGKGMWGRLAPQIPAGGKHAVGFLT